MNTTTSKFVHWIARGALGLIARLETVGWEQVPASGQGYVVAANHVGRLDAFLVYALLDRPDIIVMVAEKYRRYALTRFLVRLVDGIFVDRYNADFGAVRETLRRLKKGGILAMTPEGTRSATGNLIAGKPGGIYLAWKAGVPILPVAVTGSEDAVVAQRLKHFRRLEIRIAAGAPFRLPAEADPDRDQAMRRYTDEVMCRISMLLPAERRGVYADHPRLAELLNAAGISHG
jgi:1-acyl-sn-glycerol-3-phosphate acyltransferase